MALRKAVARPLLLTADPKHLAMAFHSLKNLKVLVPLRAAFSSVILPKYASPLKMVLESCCCCATLIVYYSPYFFAAKQGGTQEPVDKNEAADSN